MIDIGPDRMAAAMNGVIVAEGRPGTRPDRAAIDSREVGGGELFFGLPGENVDGGRFASAAIDAGVWGVVLTPEAADDVVDAIAGQAGAGVWVFSVVDPLLALQRLAREWRREIGCPLVGITGSTGKTSAKDITRAILPARVHASSENFNTEIGMPLSLLDAPEETEILVMEMAMRGMGQITELCEIAEPDVAAITNVGPVHLELLGTLEAIAEAKAEILAGLKPGGRAVLPSDAEALEPHLSDTLDVLAFGPGGDVFAYEHLAAGGRTRALIEGPGSDQPVEFEFPFDEAHNLANALCALAIGISLGFTLGEMAPRVSRVGFSRLRGEKVRLKEGILLLNDCYNANPISMRAAVEDLAVRDGARKVAILGGMAELGPDGPAYHEEIGALVRDRNIAPLIGVGDLARGYSPDLWAPDPDAAAELLTGELRFGDVALVKGSRSVGLERLTDTLRATLGEEDSE